MGTHYHLNDYSQLTGRSLFVDANVLIYLFWPTGQHSYEKNYASVFKNLILQGNKLFVDFLVISEVINRIARIEFKKSQSNLNFKQYKLSQEGKDVFNDIYIIVEQSILNQFHIVGKAFDKNDIGGFLVTDDLDFVDKAIVSTCSENNLVLLTNDRDFKNCGLDVLTGNPHILN